MSSMVTGIIAAGRNWTIDHNAREACDVVIKVFTCIKIAWDRVGNMFATVLTIIITIWRPGLRKFPYMLRSRETHFNFSKRTY